MAITNEQAMTAREFHEYSPEKKKCIRWRRNGKTRTWKTRPTQYEIPVKYGLYEYWTITEITGRLPDGSFHVAEECPHV